jgi:hypothetical protein
MRSTEVLRLHGGRFIDDDLQKQWVDYVAGLGADPKRVRPELVIMQDDDGYHLHLSVKTPGPSGKGDLLDLATNGVVSSPLVIDLGHERTWPEPTRRTAELVDFCTALYQCRGENKKISRDGWNASGQWVVYQHGYPDGIPINANTAEATGIPEGTECVFRPYLMLHCADGSFVPWQPTVSDVLARDWVTVETWPKT